MTPAIPHAARRRGQERYGGHPLAAPLADEDGRLVPSGAAAPIPPYKAITQQIRAIFAEHTPVIEPLSLDEAYLDVTENIQCIPLARDIALAIRTRIKAETGLNASAGIS